MERDQMNSPTILAKKQKQNNKIYNVCKSLSSPQSLLKVFFKGPNGSKIK